MQCSHRLSDEKPKDLFSHELEIDGEKITTIYLKLSTIHKMHDRKRERTYLTRNRRRAGHNLSAHDITGIL
ncbi:hypothetical protein FG625_023855 [Salmonella enterica subsp. enterica serovar Johannesburg]|nr:hypothetical protein FG625_023855 [Salmonella enterica subsp. enterica serovar Johannesburg]